MLGDEYGKLTIVAEANKRKGQRYVVCRCACGTVKEVRLGHLRDDRTRSCGCLLKEKPNHLKHGLSGKRVYRIWHNMRQRCRNPKAISFKYYGAKGIGYCQKWESFAGFYEDMGEPPTTGHTLDRIDSSSDYFKENCRWATHAEQALNNKRSKTFWLDGELYTCQSLAKKIGWEVRNRLAYRINTIGWSPEKALMDVKWRKKWQRRKSES